MNHRERTSCPRRDRDRRGRFSRCLVHEVIAGLLLALAVSIGFSSTARAADLKPRIVVLTDISPPTVEPDDLESLIRLLVHADLFEIEGLVATTGWSNGGGQERPDLIQEAIRAYELDLPNLRKRSAQTRFLRNESRQRIGYWPSPEYLRSRTMLGSRTRGMQSIGRNNGSPGSDLIVRMADESDERPVWVLGWGGGNTLAQAIWRVQQDRTPERFRSFLQKLRFYGITDQDRGYQAGTPYDISSHQWMRREFTRDLVFLWDECAWLVQNETGRNHWEEYAAQIQGKAHLGALYPKYRYGVEGDTPSFLYVLPNGLSDPETPGHGGWGGRFVWGTGPDGITQAFTNHRGLPGYAAARERLGHFYSAIYNSFVARMNWAQNGTGNHEPVVSIAGIRGLEVLTIQPRAGTRVSLDASASVDPDGDPLRFSWWVMNESGTYPGVVTIDGAGTRRASIEVPPDAAGKTIHVVCEVTDEGTPPLTGYRRIILEPTASPVRK